MFKIIKDEDKSIILYTFIGMIVTTTIIFYLGSAVLEMRYRSAVALINDQKWYQAEPLLRSISNFEYKDAEILHNYVRANIKLDLIDQKDLHDHNYSQVIDYLNQIPIDYQGKFKNEIIAFRNDILQQDGTNQLIDQNTNASSPKSILTFGKCLYFE